MATTDQKGSAGAMDNSLLVSLSQQLAAYRSMDVIANNLANVSTPGFKREAAKFEEYVTQVRPSEGQTGLQTLSFVAGCRRGARSRRRAALATTGAPFDVAINGKGYFVGPDAARRALHPRRPFHARRRRPDRHQQTAIRVQGDGGADHHHARRRRHPYRRRRHVSAAQQRPDRQAAAWSISPTSAR